MTLEQRIQALATAVGLDIKSLKSNDNLLKSTTVFVSTPKLFFTQNIVDIDIKIATKCIINWGTFLDADENFANAEIMVNAKCGNGFLTINMEAVNNNKFRGNFNFNYIIDKV